MEKKHFYIIITLDELQIVYDETAFEDDSTLTDLIDETL